MMQVIENLVIKRVVEPVPMVEQGQGFYSNLFLVPKKSEGWRPVLKLKPLNHFVNKQGYKLDSIRSIKNAIQP